MATTAQCKPREDRIKEEIGEELYNICNAGDLSATLTYITQQKAENPSFEPHFSSMIKAAASNDDVALMKYCLASGGKVTSTLLDYYPSGDRYRTYEVILVDKAVDPNYVNGYSGDILTIAAAIDDDTDFVKLCFAHGADPNRNLFEGYKTALAAVAELASVAMAELFLENGAVLKGSGAIILAAAAGKTKMVEFLLAKGADINEFGIWQRYDRRTDEEVGTALHQAVREGNNGLVALLLKRGANVELKDAKGRTPVALAEARGNQEVVAMLKE